MQILRSRSLNMALGLLFVVATRIRRKNDTSLLHIDLNQSSIVQIIKIKGMDGNLAREIIANRPYYSFNELKTKNPTLKDNIINQIKNRVILFP